MVEVVLCFAFEMNGFDFIRFEEFFDYLRDVWEFFYFAKIYNKLYICIQQFIEKSQMLHISNTLPLNKQIKAFI